MIFLQRGPQFEVTPLLDCVCIVRYRIRCRWNLAPENAASVRLLLCVSNSSYILTWRNYSAVKLFSKNSNLYDHDT